MTTLVRDESTGNLEAVLVRHYDTHVHGRRGAVKQMLLGQASKRMCGGAFEPNTNPHLCTCDDVEEYLDEALEIEPNRLWSGSIYFKPDTSIAEVGKAWKRRIISHVKKYPPHGTTYSDESQVTPEMLLDVNSPAGKSVCAFAEMGVPFKTHGEVLIWNGNRVHPQNREGVWYSEIQPRFDDLYRKRGLRQIHAHITTEEAADYAVENGHPDTCVFEITGHHLFDDWNQQFDGGFLLPDKHWLPTSKDEYHTDHVRGLVRKKLPFIHAGSDMAGHDTRNKYAEKAFGGGFTYHCSLELYIQVLESLGVLDFADDFLYGNAKRFHKDLVPDNPPPFRLIREDWQVSECTKYDGGEMTPYGYDSDPKKRITFRWKLAA